MRCTMLSQRITSLDSIKAEKMEFVNGVQKQFVKNVRFNGTPITESGEYTLEIGDFCERVIVE